MAILQPYYNVWLGIWRGSSRRGSSRDW